MSYVYQPRRISLHQAIEAKAHHVFGDLLDVGAGEFDRYGGLFPQKKRFVRMDIAGVQNVDIHGEAENLPFKDGSFDSILCTETLMCVYDLQKAFSEFYRVLRPGGVILITNPMYSPAHGDWDFWRITPGAFHRLAQDHKFEIVSLDPVDGYFGVKGQMGIRRQMLFFSNKIFRVLARLYGAYMLWRDKKGDATNTTSGYIVIMKKIS